MPVRANAPAASSALTMARPACLGARKTARAPRTISAGVVARSTIASASTSASLGSGRGVHGSCAGTSAGSGSVSKRTVVMSTPETPSTRQWWDLATTAKRSPSTPSTSHISQTGLARSRRCEKTRAANMRSCSSDPGSGRAVWRTW